MRATMDGKAMAALSGGHLAVDFAAGAVPALIPFLADRYSLSYTATAAIMLAVTATSSLVQPAFGLLSDRRGALWLLPGGVALAGVGIGLSALVESYWLVVALVLAAGIGIAAYHPEGAKFAHYASGPRRSGGMAVFNIGGNAGYALGPLVVTPLVLWLGLGGASLAALPVLAVAALLVVALRRVGRLAPAREAPRRYAAGEAEVRGMAVLVVVIVARSIAWFGLLTFVPLYLVSLGRSEAHGNHLLSLMLVAGAIGSLLVGVAADRIGARRTLVLTQAALTPLVAVFLLDGGALGALALAGVGICVVGSFGTTIVLGQEYLPRHVGMASGLVVGLAMGVGGVAAISLGAVADALDLGTALWICAFAPLAGVAASLLLPAERGARSPAAEAAEA